MEDIPEEDCGGEARKGKENKVPLTKKTKQSPSTENTIFDCDQDFYDVETGDNKTPATAPEDP